MRKREDSESQSKWSKNLWLGRVGQGDWVIFRDVSKGFVKDRLLTTQTGHNGCRLFVMATASKSDMLFPHYNVTGNITLYWLNVFLLWRFPTHYKRRVDRCHLIPDRNSPALWIISTQYFKMTNPNMIEIYLSPTDIKHRIQPVPAQINSE